MRPSPESRYAVAVLATGVALGLRGALDPLLGDRSTYATLYPAVVLVAGYGGLGPALVSLAGGALGASLFLPAPLDSFAIGAPAKEIALAVFLVTGLLAALLGHTVHEGRRRAQEAAALARQKQERLEGEVVEREQAEQALRAKEQQLEEVTNSTSVLLTQCTRDLRFVFANRACEEFFGRPREEIVGQPIESIIGKEALASIRPQVEKVLRGEVVEYETEVPYAHAGRRFMHVKYVPDRGPDGDVRGWFASVTDITAPRRADEALREADRRKDEFLATLGPRAPQPARPHPQRACSSCGLGPRRAGASAGRAGR